MHGIKYLKGGEMLPIAFCCRCLIIQYSLLLQIHPSLITMSNANTLFCILLLDDINTF